MHKTIEKSLKTYSKSRECLIRLLGFNPTKFHILKRKPELHMSDIQKSFWRGKENVKLNATGGVTIR